MRERGDEERGRKRRRERGGMRKNGWGMRGDKERKRGGLGKREKGKERGEREGMRREGKEGKGNILSALQLCSISIQVIFP